MKAKVIGEFKKFIARGNVIDLAVGVIIGSAFTAITNSVVNDIIMPIVGILTGGVDFSDMRIVLKPATETAAEVAIRYGALINSVLNFLIVSIVIFCMIKSINTLKDKTKKEEEAEKSNVPPKKADDVLLLEEIRDLLKEKNKN